MWILINILMNFLMNILMNILMNPMTFLLGILAASMILSCLLHRCIGLSDAVPCILILFFLAVVFW